MRDPEKWIIPGDWVIREGPSEAESFQMDGAFKLPQIMMREDHERRAFTDHAVYVYDITKTHITLFSPIAGQMLIFQLSQLGGEWHQATERQVKATWNIAPVVRGSNQAQFIQMEMERYPYKGGKRG